jgi:hypothetical protein
VRTYNAAWNYYAGMSEREIEAEIRRDTVWQRPSWKLGMRHGPAYEAHMRDPFNLYAGKERKTGKTASRRRAGFRCLGARRLGARAGAGGVRHRPAVHPDKA